MNQLRKKYCKLFSIEEIENSEMLQKLIYVLMIGFFLGFQELFFRKIGMVQRTGFTCPEYFQTCSKLFFLPSVFESSLFNLFFTIQNLFLFGAVYSAFKKRWDIAHACLLIPFFTKLVFNIFLTTNISVPFETDHLLPCALLLFGWRKKENIKTAVIILYILSGVVKLHEAWIAGTYFTTLKMGLPYVPDVLIPVATNLVIFIELFAVWYLLNSRTQMKKSVLYCLVFFHFYSSLFVTFNYPIQILPIILVVFGLDESPKGFPSKFGALVLILVMALNFAPFMIKGDEKMTYEGTALALNMFDSNRQTNSEEKIFMKDGQIKLQNTSAQNAVERVTPYTVFMKLKQQCTDPAVERIGWKMKMSLNGSPFYNLVDVPDACKLEYKAYSHNEWLKLDKEIAGYPEKNFYYGPNGLRTPPSVFATPQIIESKQTELLKEHQNVIIGFYILLALAAPILVFKY